MNSSSSAAATMAGCVTTGHTTSYRAQVSRIKSTRAVQERREPVAAPRTACVIGILNKGIDTG